MRTKIIYCLTSDNTDYYYEQLLISLYSLRKYNPNISVELVCDDVTYKTFTGLRTKVFSYCDKITSIQSPSNWTKVERSRYLKTNLRNLIDGDYLFIDTDTIICAPLDAIDELSYNIGAVYQEHIHRPMQAPFSTTSETWLHKHGKKVGVDFNDMNNFNSGVMFVKDKDITRSFYCRWDELYKQYQKAGVWIDQFSLALTNSEFNNIITPIDDRFNCQVKYSGIEELIQRAFIMHYFYKENYYIISSPWLLDPIKETDAIPITIQKIVNNPVDFFKSKSTIVTGKDVDYQHSLFHIVYDSPRLSKLFLNQIKFYIRVKELISNLFRKKQYQKVI